MSGGHTRTVIMTGIASMLQSPASLSLYQDQHTCQQRQDAHHDPQAGEIQTEYADQPFQDQPDS
jgi:hypothetical protein